MTLPIAPVERIMRKAGAERLSDGAVKAMAVRLEEYAEEMTEDAMALAKHAGRRTLTAEDIRLAKKA